MKKTLCLFILGLLLGGQFADAQGLQVGVKGAVNSTWLFNEHVSGAPSKEQNYIPSFGQTYGLSGAIFFSKNIGVEMNLFYATHRQKYSNDDIDFESETTLNQVNVPMMLKIRSSTGAYFEIGVAYNILTSAEYSLEVDSFSIPVRDIEPLMANSSIDAMFGIGVDINLFAGLSLTTALRFTYSLTDLKGVDAFGGDLSNANWLNAIYDGNYEDTHAASAGFLLGLTYSIGKIAGD